jgi:hypothetical protein
MCRNAWLTFLFCFVLNTKTPGRDDALLKGLVIHYLFFLTGASREVLKCKEGKKTLKKGGEDSKKTRAESPFKLVGVN